MAIRRSRVQFPGKSNFPLLTSISFNIVTFDLRSRDEIAKLQERKGQVGREAARMEELKRMLTADNKSKLPQLSRTVIPPDQKVGLVVV